MEGGSDVEAGRRQRGALEHEVVAVLVGHGDAMTPGQVRDALDADLAYTTIMTTLARLSEKGVVTRHRAGRAYAYRAVVDQDEIAARQMQRLLDTRDDRAAVLSRFVGTLSDDDERLLAELLARTDPGAATP
jgi:predicted transcriptional regulator